MKIMNLILVILISTLFLSGCLDNQDYSRKVGKTNDVVENLPDTIKLNIPIFNEFSMIQTFNGTYLLVYHLRSSDLEYIYSIDGENWSLRQKLFPNRTDELHDPFLIQWDDGRIMLIFNSEESKDHWVSFSTDIFNWTTPQESFFENDPEIFCNIRTMSKLNDGRIVTVSSGGSHVTNIHITDDGINWKLHSTAKGWFNSLIQTYSGDYYAVGEYSDGKDHWYYSQDNKNWETKSQLEIYLTPIMIESDNGTKFIASTFNTATSDAEPPPDIVIFINNEKDEWSIPVKIAYEVYETDICFFENNKGQLCVSFIRYGVLEILYFSPGQLLVEFD